MSIITGMKYKEKTLDVICNSTRNRVVIKLQKKTFERNTFNSNNIDQILRPLIWKFRFP